MEISARLEGLCSCLIIAEVLNKTTELLKHVIQPENRPRRRRAQAVQGHDAAGRQLSRAAPSCTMRVPGATSLIGQQIQQWEPPHSLGDGALETPCSVNVHNPSDAQLTWHIRLPLSTPCSSSQFRPDRFLKDGELAIHIHSTPYRATAWERSAGFWLSVQNLLGHQQPPIVIPMGCASRCLLTATDHAGV